MTLADAAQVVALLALLLLAAGPLGAYMARVFAGERTFLDGILGPCERLVYRAGGVDPEEEMGWRRYAAAMLAFNAAGLAALLALLLLQGVLPLNPRGLPGFDWDLALGTAVSFVTNTNWQNYAGEASAGALVQMAGFAVQNFLSAATGIAIAVALVRGLARQRSATIGNFWADLVRVTLYVLLPLSLVAALLLVSQGVIQSFGPYRPIEPLEARAAAGEGAALLPLGPVASQEAIKEIGTNGGGYFNANSAHPFENPTPLTNFLEIFLILLIPVALTWTFGRMAGDPRQGRALLAAMLALLLAAGGALVRAETRGNPLLAGAGVAGPGLEGKETRFGVVGSALFATATTATSCGAVDAMHDSLTPLGGLVPLGLILLGEVAPGGVGSGLYTMLAFVLIAVFVAGLMIGRTPEYLGKKIEAREMWLAIVTVLTPGALVLVFSGVAVVLPAGLATLGNPGAHGLSEVLYAFASMANNNGSAFAGLGGDTPFYNLAGALAMALGRFVPAVAVLAMAGSLAARKAVPPSLGTLPTHQAPFVLWLMLVVLVVGALTFFPALACGPIVEHFLMSGGR
ncbi:MAG TPA: potassium-transporting ATPase subunit KdpA [bacterium]